MVKSNLNYSCTEFHKFLQTKPELLRKISGTEKYRKIQCQKWNQCKNNLDDGSDEDDYDDDEEENAMNTDTE